MSLATMHDLDRLIGLQIRPMKKTCCRQPCLGPPTKTYTASTVCNLSLLATLSNTILYMPLSRGLQGLQGGIPHRLWKTCTLHSILSSGVPVTAVKNSKDIVELNDRTNLLTNAMNTFLLKPNLSIQKMFNNALNASGSSDWPELLARRLHALCSGSCLPPISRVRQVLEPRLGGLSTTSSFQVLKTLVISWCISHRYHEENRLKCVFGCSVIGLVCLGRSCPRLTQPLP